MQTGQSFLPSLTSDPPGDQSIATTSLYLTWRSSAATSPPRSRTTTTCHVPNAASIAWIKGTGAADYASLEAIHAILETKNNDGSEQRIDGNVQRRLGPCWTPGGPKSGAHAYMVEPEPSGSAVDTGLMFAKKPNSKDLWTITRFRLGSAPGPRQ